ncbi:molybdopterin-guanine dinucleotide biosynthesis protein B [Alkalihalobacillus oceani]|nr:molybdopterin-guanine dinucleotide biosynthesis protein B [Halalkalibacter oceani]
MEQYSPVLQVVGFQNSGKTTLAEKLIKTGGELGLKVAAIKHHGHNTPQKPEAGLKDSERHRQAGAAITAVEGGGSLQIHIQQQSWSLAEILALYEQFSPDLIVVEGYKKAPYPKLVLLRGEEDLELLQELTNVRAVITWKQLRLGTHPFPVFSLEEADRQLASFIQSVMPS